MKIIKEVSLSALAHNLAEHITIKAVKKGNKAGKHGYYLLDEVELEEIIKKYLDKIIK